MRHRASIGGWTCERASRIYSPAQPPMLAQYPHTQRLPARRGASWSSGKRPCPPPARIPGLLVNEPMCVNKSSWSSQQDARPYG